MGRGKQHIAPATPDSRRRNPWRIITAALGAALAASLAGVIVLHVLHHALRNTSVQQSSLNGGFAAPPRLVRVAPPNASFAWLLGRNGELFRQGIEMVLQEQHAPTREDLLAGSAPSPRVCWVVGRHGTVLLTTDASNWRLLTAPTSADLVRVDSTAAATATVTAADGARWSTHDAGVTWQKVSS
ncbi:MAG TPA: hypothetical protein VEJ86_00530 [Candidatus Binataceae bacterium]|nr:hypothetical protein [Candidatus Binataceae bacterium]